MSPEAINEEAKKQKASNIWKKMGSLKIPSSFVIDE